MPTENDFAQNKSTDNNGLNITEVFQYSIIPETASSTFYFKFGIPIVCCVCWSINSICNIFPSEEGCPLNCHFCKMC